MSRRLASRAQPRRLHPVQHDAEVSARWAVRLVGSKDRQDGNKSKPEAVSGDKFSRLFLQHVLPDRFVRIRHYGLLASRRRKDLERCREQLGGRKPPKPHKESWAVAFRRLFGTDPLLCPRCQVGRFVVRDVLPPLRL